LRPQLICIFGIHLSCGESLQPLKAVVLGLDGFSDFAARERAGDELR